MQLYLGVINDTNCQGKTVDFVLQLPEDMDVRRPYSQCPVDRPQTPSAEHHCICQRPKTAIACHKCDFRYVGRVRRTCPAHPRVSAPSFNIGIHTTKSSRTLQVANFVISQHHKFNTTCTNKMRRIKTKARIHASQTANYINWSVKKAWRHD